MPAQTEPVIDLATLRSCQRDTPQRPYETFLWRDRWSERAREKANETIDDVWQQGQHPGVRLEVPVAWRTICSSDRGWAFVLYCWDALAPLLAGYDNEGDPEYLHFAVAVARDWAQQHASLDSDADFAWYDMATGIRAYRLAYILDAALRRDDVSDAAIADLVDSVLLHMEALRDDTNFAPHSNHGFYFAAGQLALSLRLRCLPGMEAQESQARDRLEQLLVSQFFIDEGTHREHSTYYHWMIYETFEGLIRARLLEGRRWEEQSRRIQEALAWFILPNGRMAMFGDTPRAQMIRPDRDRPSSPHWDFVTSGGRRGKPPAASWRGFPEAGYAVLRDGWPAGVSDFGDWSYLAQTCGFHSRVHKHADDLSLVWYDHGHEILVDAGRFGYLDKTRPDSDLAKQGFYYAHPHRVYVETTRAHNTVEIDGRSYQRRGVKPYGSALRDVGERAGVYYTVASVRHFRTIRHRRVLLLCPRRWLLVMDWLHDNEKKAHEFVQRFHFAPELKGNSAGSGVSFRLPRRGPSLHMVPLLAGDVLPLVKGHKDPLLGWISRRDGDFDPCWSTGVGIEDRPVHALGTLFQFGSSPPVPFESNVNTTGRRGLFQWSDGRSRHGVAIEIGDGEQLTVDYRVRRIVP